jgi:hypothetical protein
MRKIADEPGICFGRGGLEALGEVTISQVDSEQLLNGLQTACQILRRLPNQRVLIQLVLVLVAEVQSKVWL